MTSLLRPIRIAIVGAGVMGANHARVASRAPSVELVGIVDVDRVRREKLADAHATRNASTVAQLRQSTDVDAVVVATPTALHYSIVSDCLDANLHVLVEKPIAATMSEGVDLDMQAARAGLVLTVGHIERFNPAVRELLRQSTAPIHIELLRVGPFTPRVSDNVVVDLMIHDLDLARLLARSEVVDVQAIHQSTKTTGPDMASALLRFENGVTASVTASRIGQQKIRSIVITENDAVFVADLIRQDLKIHRMQHVEFVGDSGAAVRQSGVVEMPFIENRNEALAEELSAFVLAIRGGKPAVSASDGTKALGLVHRVLDLSQR